MTDIIMPNTSKKTTSMNAPSMPVNDNPLGLDLGEFRLTSDACKRANQSGYLVYGLEFYLFEQCSDKMNSPILHLNCEAQTQEIGRAHV